MILYSIEYALQSIGVGLAYSIVDEEEENSGSATNIL